MTRYKGSLAFFLVVSFALACGRSGLELGGPKAGGQSGTTAAGGAPGAGGAGGSGGSPVSGCCQKDFDCGDAA